MKISFSSWNSLTIGILSMILASLCVASTAPPPARADSGVRQQGQEKKEDFTDEDLKVEKVEGKWMLGTGVDVKQAFDPSVPVAVSRMLTVYGQGKHLGRIKIPKIVIKNRSQKVLQSVQLRWTVANDDDRDTILLEGLTPFIPARIEPFNPPLLLEQMEPLYFNKIVKPLLKDGELNFHVLIRVGVQEARFADGTVWQDGREKKERFTDEDLKVDVIKGRWSAQSDLDEKQFNDPSVPVYVKGINMFWGRGKFLGRMKIPEVILENRSPRQSSSVRLKWTITSQDEPDVVLLEGVTPLFEARINSYSAARVDVPEIYFNKILKPLRKEEELNGRFRLVLGVHEVQFSDGQQWPLLQAASFVAISYAKRPPDSPPLNLGTFAYFYGVTSDMLTRRTPNAAPCENWPGLLAPAFSMPASRSRQTLRAERIGRATQTPTRRNPSVLCLKGDIAIRVAAWTDGVIALWPSGRARPARTTMATVIPLNGAEAQTVTTMTTRFVPGHRSFVGTTLTMTATTRRIVRTRHARTTAPTTTGTTTAKFRATVKMATSTSTPGRPILAATVLIATASTATPRASRVI
jgi:hypothetical protein